MERQSAGGSESGENVLSSIALNDNKAGMEGLDRDKINKIILEASKVCWISIYWIWTFIQHKYQSIFKTYSNVNKYTLFSWYYNIKCIITNITFVD